MVRKTSNSIIIALTLIAAQVATAVRAEVEYRETLKNIPIGDDMRTKSDIRRAIRRNSPLLGGKHAFGSAAGRILPKWRLKRNGNFCSLAEALFIVEVTIRMPHWEHEFQADKGARDYFACIHRTVMIHEKRHAEIWIETAQRMESEFYAQLQNVPCSNLQARGSQIYKQLFDESRKRQSAFDSREYKLDRLSSCWSGSDNWDSVKELPQFSGRYSWSDPDTWKASQQRARRLADNKDQASDRSSEELDHEPSRAITSGHGASSSSSRTSAGLRHGSETGNGALELPNTTSIAWALGGIAAILALLAAAFFGVLNLARSFGDDEDDIPSAQPSSNDWTRRAMTSVPEKDLR